MLVIGRLLCETDVILCCALKDACRTAFRPTLSRFSANKAVFNSIGAFVTEALGDGMATKNAFPVVFAPLIVAIADPVGRPCLDRE